MGPEAPCFHERAVARRQDPVPCVIKRLDGYPYDCGAARKYPDDLVFICHSHRCWWHIDPTTEKERTPWTGPIPTA